MYINLCISVLYRSSSVFYMDLYVYVGVVQSCL